MELLANIVFPNIWKCFSDHEWLCEHVILAPKNNSVTAINLQIQQQLPGETTSYKSVDTVKDVNKAVQYPSEFLNSLESPGMQPHNLVFKVGSAIMLLRNLDAPRLCVKHLMSHVIEATIPTDMPFEFKRLQFPVRLAFEMSSNRVQWQSFKDAVINPETPSFSHGQLHVACSRVRIGKNV